MRTRPTTIVLCAFAVWMGAYIVAFVGSAWHPTDYEYTFALAWRVYHGEVPYRDFLYQKPPGTVVLHAIWFLLPDSLEVRASRVFVYLQMVVATLAPLVWLLRRRLIDADWRLPLLALATTAVALHNFPITPVPTIDGVCFAALGWTCLLESRVAARRALGWRAAASVLLALGVLCKQSFVTNAAAFALFAAGELVWGWRSAREARRVVVARFVASALPALAVLGATVAWLVLAGAWPTSWASSGRSRRRARCGATCGRRTTPATCGCSRRGPWSPCCGSSTGRASAVG